jgi:thiosulfate/3-mercaptopyruvate sulfurtransferase
LLSGGIQAWGNHGYPLAVGYRQETASPVNYKIHLRPEVYITTQEVEEQKSDLVLVDTRSTFEWLKGHLPEAVHINWKDLYSGDVRRPIAPDQMRKLLSRHTIGNKKAVVYYCTGGIRSGYAWLVHTLSGLPTARNYEGGTEAWKRRSRQ